MDAAELDRGRLRSRCRRSPPPPRRRKPGAPRVWDGLPRQYLLRRADRRQGRDRCRLRARRARRQAPFRHQPRHRRHHGAARRGRRLSTRPTAATPSTRRCSGRIRPAPNLAKVLKVPESKVRIITGDIGGSFGMKSPVFNESPLVLLASKLTGRPVKWISTRTEAFLSDAQARDNVTEAELALDKDGIFLALAGEDHRRHRRLSAARHAGLRAQRRHARRRLPHAGDACRHHRGVHQHQSGAALSRQRPARGRLRDRAHGRSRRRRTGHRSGRTAPAQLHSAQRDAVQDRPDVHLRLRRVRKEHGPGARARRRQGLQGAQGAVAQGAANCAASASPTPSSAPPPPSTEGAEVRFDRAGTATLFSGSNSQGQGHETVFKQLVCDRLGLDPDEVHYVQGDTDEVFYGEGTGGSRSATHGRLGLPHGDREGHRARRAPLPRICSRSTPTNVNFADGVFSTPKTNRTLTIKEIAADSSDPANLPQGMEPGLFATAVYTAPVDELSERLPHLRTRDRPGHRQGRDRALFRGRRCRHRAQSAAAARPDPRRRRARRRPGADGRHPFRRAAASSSPARSWITPCRTRMISAT